MQDKLLIEKSLKGDKKALETLLSNHQDWIYNAAINLTNNTEDAADLMQETLIKMITNLSGFQHKSAFRTWAYRILKNTFLNTKRKSNYHQVIPWEEYGNGLDAIPDEQYKHEREEEIVEEAKLSCMKGMLLCLSPEQRLVYVLGEMLSLPDSTGSEIMEISKANFRKKLSRTRAQLYDFMNKKCGLINKKNPCRCARKTKGFIEKGYVNPDNLQFQKDVIEKIEKVIEKKVSVFDNEVYVQYQQLYLNHNFQRAEDSLASLKQILSSKSTKDTFNF